MMNMLEIILMLILIVIIAVIIYNVIKGLFKFALIGILVIVVISILSGLILRGQIQDLVQENEFYVVYRIEDNFEYGYLFSEEIIPLECNVIDQVNQRYNEEVDVDRPVLIFDSLDEIENKNITINNYEFSNSQKQTILDSNNPTNMINTILEDEGYEKIEKGNDNCVLKILFLDIQDINKSELLQEDYELYPGNFWINMFHKIPFDFMKKNMFKVANYVARNNLTINSSYINETINSTKSKFDLLKSLMDKTE